jgi:hypothetical protein
MVFNLVREGLTIQRKSKAVHTGGVAVQLHKFLTSAQDLVIFTLWPLQEGRKTSRYIISRELGGLQSQLGGYG